MDHFGDGPYLHSLISLGPATMICCKTTFYYSDGLLHHAGCCCLGWCSARDVSLDFLHILLKDLKEAKADITGAKSEVRHHAP